MESFGGVSDIIKQGGFLSVALIFAYLWWRADTERRALAADKDKIQTAQFERLLNGLNGATAAISSFRDFLGVRSEH